MNLLKKIHQQVSRILLDKETEIQLSLSCLLAGGHLLIEDLPGVGKTTFVNALGRTLGFGTSRIQFTSDLLPADIIGNMIYNEGEKKFSFHPGPLFSHLVMADELNRANPRTQSSLLQAMEEGQVAVDGKNRSLPQPFYLIATQNPQSQIGTFPLPESQLDRFLMALEIKPASKAAELQLIQGHDIRDSLYQLEALVTPSQWLELCQKSQENFLSPKSAQYIQDLLLASRDSSFLGQHLSTRAGIALARAAKAMSFIRERNGVLPEDIQTVARGVLAHRLGGGHGLQFGLQKLEELLSKVSVPV